MNQISVAQYAMAQDFLATFTTPPGARVLAHLKETCHDKLSYTPGDPYHTMKNEGLRELYLLIVRNMELAKDPEKYVVIVEGGPADDEQEAA